MALTLTGEVSLSGFWPRWLPLITKDEVYQAQARTKKILEDAGFNDGGGFRLKDARDVAIGPLENLGYMNPKKLVSDVLWSLEKQNALWRHLGGVYTFRIAPTEEPLKSWQQLDAERYWAKAREPEPEDHRRIQMTRRFTQLRDTLNQEMESDHPTESSDENSSLTERLGARVPDTLSSSKRLQQIAQLKEWMDACETIDV